MSIESSPSLNWANNETQTKGLKEARKKLEDEIRKSEFASAYMMEKATDVAKTYGSSFMANCGALCQSLDPLIDRLARESSAVVQMKIARDRSLKSGTPPPAKKTKMS